MLLYFFEIPSPHSKSHRAPVLAPLAGSRFLSLALSLSLPPSQFTSRCRETLSCGRLHGDAKIPLRAGHKNLLKAMAEAQHHSRTSRAGSKETEKKKKQNPSRAPAGPVRGHHLACLLGSVFAAAAVACCRWRASSSLCVSSGSLRDAAEWKEERGATKRAKVCGSASGHNIFDCEPSNRPVSCARSFCPCCCCRCCCFVFIFFASLRDRFLLLASFHSRLCTIAQNQSFARWPGPGPGC